MPQKIVRYRRQMLQYTDKRVKLMNQLLVGIRVLKMYVWEVGGGTCGGVVLGGVVGWGGGV